MRLQSLLNFIFFSTACLLMIVGKWHHELWLDEHQAMGIAKASSTLKELWQHHIYEGHPMGYFVILYILKSFAGSDIAIQVLHGCFACVAFYFLYIKSELPWYIKLALVFSLCFVNEYAIFNRVYIIGIALLLCQSFLMSKRKLGVIEFTLFITGAFLLDAYIAAVEIGLFVYYALNYHYEKKIWLLCGIVLINAMFLYISVVQPLDASVSFKSVLQVSHVNWNRLISGFGFGFHGMQNLGANCGSGYYPFSPVLLFFIVMYILVVCFLLLYRRVFFLSYLTVVCCILYINMQSGAAGIRHTGFYLIAFLCLLIIACGKNEMREVISKRALLLLPLLTIQGFWGVYYFKLDVELPYSLVKSSFIELSPLVRNNPEKVVGYGCLAVVQGAAFFDHPITNLQTCEYNWYYKWNNSNELLMDTNKAIFYKINECFKQKDTFLLVLNLDERSNYVRYCLDSIAKQKNNGILPLPCYLGAIEAREQYFNYYIVDTIKY